LIAFIPAAYFLLSPERDDHSIDESHEGKIPLFGKKVMPLWWIGIGLLGGLIAEGAASDWGAILLRDEMGFDKGVNATAFASFSLAMITSRFLGDRTLDRLGPAKTVRLSGYIGGFGWGAALLIAVPLSQSHPAIALVVINLGFICAGYGIGPMFPAFIVAASKTPGVSPAVAMARVGVIGLAGFFIGPTLIGLLSDVFTLQIAMFYPVVALLFAGFLSRTIHVK
jgi:fucose permease